MSNPIELNQTQRNPLTTTEKYQAIPTADIMSKLQAGGWEISSVSKAGTRNPSKQGYEKHLVRMRHPEVNLDVAGVTPELLLLNSYSGDSSFRLMLGAFRFACANGLIAGSAFGQVRVRHVADAVARAMAGVDEVMTQASRLERQIKELASVQVTTAQRDEICRRLQAFMQKGDDTILVVAGFTSPRRTEDLGTDGFTTLNRIQENLIRGGLQVLRRNERSGLVERRSQRVRSIDKTLAYNRLVWDTVTDVLEVA